MNKSHKGNSDACRIKCALENYYQLTLYDFFNFADRLKKSKLLIGSRNTKYADEKTSIESGHSSESQSL